MRAFHAYSPLGHEVKDTALAVFVSRIPVLDRAVFHIGVFQGDNLHDCRMKLVLVAHRSGTTLHVAQCGAFVSHDESTLELARSLGIDAEIAGKFHRAAHALRDVAE